MTSDYRVRRPTRPIILSWDDVVNRHTRAVSNEWESRGRVCGDMDAPNALRPNMLSPARAFAGPLRNRGRDAAGLQTTCAFGSSLPPSCSYAQGQMGKKLEEKGCFLRLYILEHNAELGLGRVRRRSRSIRNATAPWGACYRCIRRRYSPTTQVQNSLE